jgi:hypothetical protein
MGDAHMLLILAKARLGRGAGRRHLKITNEDCDGKTPFLLPEARMRAMAGAQAEVSDTTEKGKKYANTCQMEVGIVTPCAEHPARQTVIVRCKFCGV